MPADWIRKQTLTNAERYITPELKTYEEKILGAEEKIMTIEHALYESLVRDLGEYIEPIQLNANIEEAATATEAKVAMILTDGIVEPRFRR